MVIHIPQGTTEIPKNYYMTETNVTEFVIPESVTKIGEKAFSIYTDVAPSLQEFKVDENNRSFSTIDGVLVNKKKDKLIAFPLARAGVYQIPDGIRLIGRYAFRMAVNLTEVIIPDTVEEIEKGAFSFCRGLKRVKIGNGCQAVRQEAFEACDNLADIELGSAIEIIGKKAFVKCGACGRIALPDSLRIIEDEAFYGINKTRYKFGKNIEHIGKKAFVGKEISVCVDSSLKELLVPDIFAMNLNRKFSIEILLTDTGEQSVMSGKLSDWHMDEKTPEAQCKTIKPKLIDEKSGAIFSREEKCIEKYLATGFNIYGHEYDRENPITHIANFTPQGITLTKLDEIIKTDIDKSTGFAVFYGTTWNGENYKVNISRGMETPCVYSIDDDNVILDVSYENVYGKYEEVKSGNSSYQAFMESKRVTVPSIWKINLKTKEAVEISKEDFLSLNIRAEYEKYENSVTYNIINKVKGEYESGVDYFKRIFKYSYGDFTVPDTEESMDRFFEDSKGNIFNYGLCAVYNKSAKGNIDGRVRSYVNMYSKDGKLAAKIKVKGEVWYLFEREGSHYIVSWQRMKAVTPAVVRLYRFDI